MKPPPRNSTELADVLPAAARCTQTGLTFPGLPPFGSVTLAAAAVCVVSGLVLLAGYRASNPLLSTLRMECGQAFGWFFRPLHAWSALLFLLALTIHVADFVWRRADCGASLARWALLAAIVPVSVYLMLGGLALTGDAEAGAVASVMRGLSETMPWVGPRLASWFVGRAGDVHVLYFHHVASATIALVVLVVIHLRRLLPDALSMGTALGVLGLLALLVRPSLGPADSVSHLRGPWFMTGLRWMLGHLPPWFAGLALPWGALLLLAALPILSERKAKIARWILGLMFAAYGAASVWATLR